MKKIIVLYTPQSPYWERARQAEYVSIRHTKLEDWDALKGSCPLPGLGVYSRGMIQGKSADPTNLPFVFLKIIDMSYDEHNTYFHIEPLLVTNIPSLQFLCRIPSHNQFDSREPDYIKKILKGLQIDPPDEWLKLIDPNNS
ncbi:MAG: hypothetical protein WC980_02460 [Candidatus Brocadiia bacterium]